MEGARARPRHAPFEVQDALGVPLRALVQRLLHSSGVHVRNLRIITCSSQFPRGASRASYTARTAVKKEAAAEVKRKSVTLRVLSLEELSKQPRCGKKWSLVIQSSCRRTFSNSAASHNPR